MIRRNMPLEASLMWVKDLVTRFAAEFQYMYEFYQNFGILSRNKMKDGLEDAIKAQRSMAKAKKLEAIGRFRDALDEYETSWSLLQEGLRDLTIKAKREKYLTE